MFEILIWVKKWQVNFFQKLRACAIGGTFFLGTMNSGAKKTSSSW